MQRFAPQIEEAVFQPHVFGVRLFVSDWQREFFRCTLHRDLARIDLNFAGGEARVHCLGRTRLDLAFDRHNRFHPQPVKHRQRGRIRIDNDLGNAVMIAQIDEQQPAKIALSVNPARQADGLPHVIRRKLCASMRAVEVHLNSCPVRGYDARAPGQPEPGHYRRANRGTLTLCQAARGLCGMNPEGGTPPQ